MNRWSGFPGATLAEFVVDLEEFIVHIPKNLNFAQAAAVPLVSCTSLQALRRLELQKGQRLLILGGSSATGMFAIQYAKKVLGVTVVTTASESKKNDLIKLGADEVM